jgi:integrase
VSLKRAHSRHAAALALVKAKVDPVEKIEREEAEKRARLAAEEARRAAEDSAPTVEKLSESFLALYVRPRKRSAAEDERKLNVDVLPSLGKRRAKDVGRADVQALLDGIAARAPVAANRTKALLSRLFRWALSRGLVDVDPTAGIEAPAKERPRDRVLSEAEVRTFWQGIGATPLSDSVKRALRLVLVTAQRPGEVAGMRFEEIAEHDGRVVWTIPGARRKKDDAHAVPLSKLSLEIVGSWQGKAGPVFPGREPATPTNEPSKPITEGALAYALRRNLGEKETKAPKKKGKAKRPGLPIAPFVVHDLRRTAATLMSGAGVAGLVKPMILGHAPRGVTLRTYDLFSYLPEKAAALDAWGRRLQAIVTGEVRGKVVELRTARRAAR